MQYEQENQRKECKLKVLRTEQRGVFVFLGKEIILSKIKVLKRSDHIKIKYCNDVFKNRNKILRNKYIPLGI